MGACSLFYTGFRRRVWQAAVERAERASLTPHELRHTYVALAITQGADPLTTKGRVGHGDVTTTYNVYGPLFPDRDAVLTERMEDVFQTAKRECLAALPRPEAEDGVANLARSSAKAAI